MRHILFAWSFQKDELSITGLDEDKNLFKFNLKIVLLVKYIEFMYILVSRHCV